jgi:NADH-quinone oxidoreductase subunit L
VIAWVGTLTALYAALCAVTQRDIKKVLAYSTLSQLGYMVAAFGLGSVGAGDVPPDDPRLLQGAPLPRLGLGDPRLPPRAGHLQDGGAQDPDALTFWTFTIAVAAIVGPARPGGLLLQGRDPRPRLRQEPAVFAVLAFTAILTAFYMLRLWKIVFLGEPRGEAAGHAHEGGVSITAPLVLLARSRPSAATCGCIRGVWGRLLADPGGPGRGPRVILRRASPSSRSAPAPRSRSTPRPTGGRKTRSSSGRPAAFGFLVALRASFDRAYDYYVQKIQQRAAMVLNFIDIVGLAGIVVRGLAGAVEVVGLRRPGAPYGPHQQLRLLVPGGRRRPLGLCRRRPLIPVMSNLSLDPLLLAVAAPLAVALAIALGLPKRWS